MNVSPLRQPTLGGSDAAAHALPALCLACNREAGWAMCDLCARLTDAEALAATREDAST